MRRGFYKLANWNSRISERIRAMMWSMMQQGFKDRSLNSNKRNHSDTRKSKTSWLRMNFNRSAIKAIRSRAQGGWLAVFYSSNRMRKSKSNRMKTTLRMTTATRSRVKTSRSWRGCHRQITPTRIIMLHRSVPEGAYRSSKHVGGKEMHQLKLQITFWKAEVPIRKPRQDAL